MTRHGQGRTFLYRIENVQHRMEQLHHTAGKTPWRQPDLVISCLHELQTALEELQTAEEELRQQNEQLLIAQQLAEAEQHRYQELFEFAPDGYLVTDIYGTICEANRVAASVLNICKQDLIGKNLVSVVPEEDQRSFCMLLNQLPSINRVQEWEIKLLSQDQGLFDAALTIETVRDERGHAIALRWLLRDITARKQADEQLRQMQLQNLQLLEADRLKNQFIAMLSHELRTPMNAILGFSQLLFRQFHQGADPQVVHMVERIVSNGRHLLTLIEEMLDISRLKVNHLELCPSSFDLVELVKSTMHELQSLAKQKELSLQVSLPTNASIPVVNDRTRLHQVLINLMSNAIKFTNIGGVFVEVFELPEGRVAIAVHDTGIGIDPKHQKLIFQEFWQVNQTLTRQHNGTGLGLPITQALVKLMHGSIALESEVGVGSTFRVELPRNVNAG
ncbi:PAS domain-containing protein [Oscillatoria sp. FACHB-1407]|uniref:PAS domain-containing sensor histidine kinase n=1 Tax=Oscillatoria sp. FACHB-1407 TaxID=2692847 RepID=UPI00168552BB|nr:PAS domain-containing protein [Oscillatoria sp. FACHB-1407]MBD2461308.1 PAS domain-containing protein [Oscillatoria sp. FACHB-1407]